MSNIKTKPTSQITFKEMLPHNSTKRDEINLLPCKVIYNTYLRCFQYKILINILYLNDKLYTPKLTNSSLCSFCKHENETTPHIFYPCNSTRKLWLQLKLFLEPNLILPYLLSQTSIVGFLGQPDQQNFVLLNRLLFLFKLNVYNTRRDKVLCFNKLLRDITKVKKMGKRNRKLLISNCKWK